MFDKLYEQERVILEITERICGLMVEQNVSRAELARRLGTTQSVVTKWLDGTSVMKVREVSDMFWALESYFHVGEPPRVWIPRLGDKLILKSDWTFKLYAEQRNKSLMDFFDLPPGRSQEVTIPRGMILKVERIYIRRNQKTFDSVTFRWEKCRFWAKLDDVNTIRASYYGGEIDET